jgi:hypothetical protein
MAILRTQTNTTASGNYAADLPAGTYDALCIDIVEKSGVERKRFHSDKTEVVDVITFWFEVLGKSGERRQIRTREMLVSLYPKSALYGFLTAWCGSPPADGFDTDTLMGCKAKLTLAHAPSTTDPGKVFVRITDIAPAATDNRVGAS